MCAISLGFHGCPLVGFTGVPPPITNPILRKRLGHAPLTGDGTSTNILPLGHFGAPFAYYSAVANFCGIFEPTNVMCVVTCGTWGGAKAMNVISSQVTRGLICNMLHFAFTFLTQFTRGYITFNVLISV